MSPGPATIRKVRSRCCHDRRTTMPLRTVATSGLIVCIWFMFPPSYPIGSHKLLLPRETLRVHTRKNASGVLSLTPFVKNLGGENLNLSSSSGDAEEPEVSHRVGYRWTVWNFRLCWPPLLGGSSLSVCIKPFNQMLGGKQKPGRRNELSRRDLPHVQASAPRPVRGLLASATLEKPLIREFLFYPPYRHLWMSLGSGLCVAREPRLPRIRKAVFQTAYFVYSRMVLGLSSNSWKNSSEIPKLRFMHIEGV
jgi:hypothetical protein